MSIGRISRVALREVWRHEAHDFTTWLEANPEVLSDVLGFTIVSAERERAAGDFSVDLVGEDEDGRTIVIENQLERSDHDHLGKLLTYLAAFDARAAVWIVARARPEHARAIAWLNEATSTPFYLVQVEAVRIGDSPPAPLLTLIAGPSVEARAAGAAKRQLSERHEIRHRFWTRLLEHAKERTSLHARISPSRDVWVSAGAGLAGVGFNYVVGQHDMRVELYIDRSDAAQNLDVFDQLHARRSAVEAAFGGELAWQRLDGKRACRISRTLLLGGWRDEEKWSELIDASVDAMVRLESALREPIDAVQLGRGSVGAGPETIA